MVVASGVVMVWWPSAGVVVMVWCQSWLRCGCRGHGVVPVVSRCGRCVVMGSWLCGGHGHGVMVVVVAVVVVAV